MTSETVRFTWEDVSDAKDNMSGFCVKCGEPRECVEGDVTDYPCEACEAKAVHGAQMIIIKGLFYDPDNIQLQ